MRWLRWWLSMDTKRADPPLALTEIDAALRIWSARIRVAEDSRAEAEARNQVDGWLETRHRWTVAQKLEALILPE